jgi:16S rRNA (cytidine1402-2'-O)-methyltransferase
MNAGKLFLITTPIGNIADLTIRALESLRNTDFVICEEFKEGSKLLRQLEIEKELFNLNEHNEQQVIEEYILELLSGKNIALISDCGTPGFADPGLQLINRCIEMSVKIEFIAGANSVLTALVLSGFDISRFRFLGFLSPKSDLRKKQLSDLSNFKYSTVLMDTPYRLMTLLEELNDVVPDKKIFVGINLTTPDEQQFRGTPSEIIQEIKSKYPDEKFKAEFVLVVSPARN